MHDLERRAGKADLNDRPFRIPIPLIRIWRSKQNHPDGIKMYDGWFVMGIGVKPGKQITYHLPLSRWNETDFAQTLDHAPDWDGHTPDDVLTRLKIL
jgi:hypothetical protein